MFVIDYGLLWVSRNQAQNAADAGALAGATALALDDFDDRTATGPAKLAARSFALANNVWDAAPDVQMATDVRFYPDAPAAFPASCASDDCIRVDVYRNQARGNPLPMFLGFLVGLTNQGVRATATAQAAAANASDCLKPWAVADKWEEHNPVVARGIRLRHSTRLVRRPTSTPRRAAATRPAPASRSQRHRNVKLDAEGRVTPGRRDQPRLVPGGRPHLSGRRRRAVPTATATTSPAAASATYGRSATTCPMENGNMVGPTKQGVEDLIALDPNAEWDPTTKKVINSCIGPPYTCSKPGLHESPRVVAVPVVRPQLSTWRHGGPGNGTVHVVEHPRVLRREDGRGKDVVGYLATKPDLLVSNGGSVSPCCGVPQGHPAGEVSVSQISFVSNDERLPEDLQGGAASRRPS